MTTTKAFKTLFSRIHADQRGSVSLETILIVAAIALPILIYVLKFGWPRVRDYFYDGLKNLEDASKDAANNSPSQ